MPGSTRITRQPSLFTCEVVWLSSTGGRAQFLGLQSTPLMTWQDHQSQAPRGPRVGNSVYSILRIALHAIQFPLVVLSSKRLRYCYRRPGQAGICVCVAGTIQSDHLANSS